MNVAVLGASAKEDTYANKAVALLQENGHTVFPVHPKDELVHGLHVYRSLSDISEPVDTLSVYVNAAISSKLAPEILALKPRRIIFNPGTENPELEAAAKNKNINVLEACTLVLLSTNQF